jgi:hypothetical protein
MLMTRFVVQLIVVDTQFPAPLASLEYISEFTHQGIEPIPGLKASKYRHIARKIMNPIVEELGQLDA